MSKPVARLDASESWFFNREQEALDTRLYEVKYPEFRAREFLPTIEGVDESDKVYTYRMSDYVGKAKVIEGYSDDLPRANVEAMEKSQIIKRVGDSYGWNIWEIKAAAKAGRSLDTALAFAARKNIEELVDEFLSYGSTKFSLTGLLTIASGTTAYTPSAKTGGGITWANATGQEMADELMAMANGLVAATVGKFTRFRVALPIALYNRLAVTRLGALSDMTALAFVKATSPFISQIDPWYRCTGVPGVGTTTNRIVMWADDPAVVGALVPQEFTTLPAEQRNLEYVVNCVASTGGIVTRYPLAISYASEV